MSAQLTLNDDAQDFELPLVRVFVYGNMLNPDLRKKLDVKVEKVHHGAILEDFKRYAVKAAPYPCAAPCKGAQIEGQVHEIHMDNLGKYDHHEGTENGLFERIKVNVGFWGGKDQRAYLYTKGPSLKASRLQGEWR